MMNDSRSRVLVIDDSLGVIELLESILGVAYEVSFASNGVEGLELASRYPPDLILLDVMMPGMNGFEVCRHLKESQITADIPVIFLTGLVSPSDEEFGLSVGAGDFISKPISPPVLLARVRNHLLIANARRELKRHNDELELLVAERTRELVQRDRKLIAAQTAIITAFCALAEARDNETGNHIRRTQHYVLALAEELRSHPRFSPTLNDEAIQLIFKSAPLHDVGKVAIPDSILLKPGKLTPEEWVIMQTHCAAGRNAIVTAARELGEGSGEFFGFAAEIAFSHHERWDGSGYPCALAGEDIPVSARLMAVADVYDALITKRVYKDAYLHDESIKMILAERGSHFDPVVIDAMMSLSDVFDDIAERFKDVVEERNFRKCERRTLPR
ncbi:MAG: two-component system response regulator [Betaproteobacteria bacterium]